MYLSSFSIPSLLPIVILLGFGALIPVLLNLLKLKFIPSLAIEILVGLVLALIPYTRNFFVTEGTNSLNGLNEGAYVVGMATLLFLSGLDTDFSVFKKHKKGDNAIINEYLLSIVCFGLVLALSVGVSFIFLRQIEGSKVIGIVLLSIFLSSTFASLVIPIVHDNDLAKTTIGHIISTYATLAELFSIVGLSVVLIIHNENRAIWMIPIIVIILLLVYIVKKFLPLEKLFKSKEGGITFLETRVAILMIVLALFMSDKAGLEYILGPFLIGMLLALLRIGHQFKEKVESIGYGILVPMFYMLAGLKVGLIIHEIGYVEFFTWQTLGLFGLVFGAMLLVRIPLLCLAKYYPLKTYLPSIFLLTSTIIVSLTIDHLSEELGIFNEKFVAILVLASFISCIIPPILFADSPDFGEAKDKYKPFILERSDFENLEEHE